MSEAKTILNEAAPVSLTIIIPVYNEREGLKRVLKDLFELPLIRYTPVIVVDDGSVDKTGEYLEGWKDRLTVIRHKSNRGYGASLKTGILSARTENVLFIDADGQHDVGQIPEMAEALRDYECVFTARKGSKGIPLVRRPGKFILHRVCNFLAARKIPDINCGFRAGRRHIYMMMLELLPNGFSFSTTSLMYVVRSRFSHIFLPTECATRIGSSSVRIIYDGLKTMLLALRLIMLFDPMRAFGYPALGLIAMGIAYQIYIFFTFRFSIVGGALLSILTGVLLFFFGLLGDQIASLRKEISSFNCLLWEDLQANEDRRRVG